MITKTCLYLIAAVLMMPSVVQSHSHHEEKFEILAGEMKTAAVELLESLNGKEKAAIRRGFEDRERKKWDFWPGRYSGVDVARLSGRRLEKANALLRTGLSEKGFTKVEVTRRLEKYNPWNSPHHYILIFGDPAEGRDWGWRIQGHHVSMNFTISDGKVIANTPAFLGAQPLSHPSISGGTEPLEKEQSLGFRLFKMLDAAKQEEARIPRPKPNFLPLRTEKTNLQKPLGLAASEMNEEEMSVLQALIDEYVENLASSIAEVHKGRIEASGLEKITFGFAGEAKAGSNHYYRIQSPSFIIEYDNRDRGTHIHCVWRDFDRDFGEDLLQKHYAQYPH